MLQQQVWWGEHGQARHRISQHPKRLPSALHWPKATRPHCVMATKPNITLTLTSSSPHPHLTLTLTLTSPSHHPHLQGKQTYYYLINGLKIDEKNSQEKNTLNHSYVNSSKKYYITLCYVTYGYILQMTSEEAGTVRIKSQYKWVFLL